MTRQLQLDREAAPDPAGIPQDELMSYSRLFNEYGITVHDGGSSQVRIRSCPWCGTALPSYRDAWFDVLDALGIEDPDIEEVPPRLRDDRWWRDRPSEERPPSDDSCEGRGLTVTLVDPEIRRSRGGLRLSKANPCCDLMDGNLNHECDMHPDPWDCPDALVGFDSAGRAGLIIHGTESSLVPIRHCPWCGQPTDSR
jgi:hypothetical protein